MTKPFTLDKPIEVGGFTLSQEGARPHSDKVKPTRQGWVQAVCVAMLMERLGPFWVADLTTWAEDRSGWSEDVIEQALAEARAQRTAYNRKSVANNVRGEARALAPTFSHAAAVAVLSPKQQVEVLKRVQAEHLTVSKTRKIVRKLVRSAVVDDQAVLEGKFRVILADPPWSYDNDSTRDDGSLAGAASSYESLTIDEICKLPVAAHAEKNAVLFLWTTASHLGDDPGPFDVIDAWGFVYKTNYVWDKVLGMPGNYSYVQHEHLLIATRGSGTPDVDILQHDHASIFTERRQGEHSEKPAFARKLIESLYPDGARLELFARQQHDGWTSFGNDARLWKASA